MARKKETRKKVRERAKRDKIEIQREKAGTSDTFKTCGLKPLQVNTKQLKCASKTLRVFLKVCQKIWYFRKFYIRT